ARGERPAGACGLGGAPPRGGPRARRGAGCGPGPGGGGALRGAALGPGSRATLLLTPASPAGPVPAIATSGFLRANHARPGSQVALGLHGTTIRIVIAGVVKAFPTAAGGLVVDQRALSDALTAAGAAPLPASQFWLVTAGAA